MKIEVKELEVGYVQQRVIKGMSLTLNEGEFCALLGPNGTGKSTLLKALIGELPVSGGKILLDSKPLPEWKQVEIAKRIALIAQEQVLQFDFTVEEYVLMGRYPYTDYWQTYTKEDQKIVSEMLNELNLAHFEKRIINQLSGGEKQRVSIARALIQDTPFLLMDESLSFLDINHQIEIMELLYRICKEKRKTILIVSHNINLSAEFCERMLLMKDGKIIADASVEEVLTPTRLKDSFGIELIVTRNPKSGKPNVLYCR